MRVTIKQLRSLIQEQVKRIMQESTYIDVHSGMSGAGDFVSLVKDDVVVQQIPVPEDIAGGEPDEFVTWLADLARSYGAKILDPDASDVLGNDDPDGLLTPDEYILILDQDF